jgi:predicted transcriptional regulator
MLAKALISETIPPLRKSDSGERALHWMHEFSVRELPVVEEKKLLKLITIDDIINKGNLDLPLGEYSSSFIHPFVYEYTHILEVIRVVSKLQIGSIPVLNENEEYIGLITAENLLNGLSQFSALSMEGSIMELEVPFRNYSLFEISRIVESNEVRILSCFTHYRSDAAVVEITLKLSSSNLSAVVSAFERYNIIVKSVYHETEYTEDLKERYNSLMRYLNV